MMRFTTPLIVCLSMLAVPSSSWSKGETVKIVIDGDNLSAPIEISSPDIVRLFSIWNGPAVSTSGPECVPHPPAYLDPTKTAGRFIDWPRGIATDLPSGMRRLEVTFHIAGQKTQIHAGKYWFAYEIDFTTQRGYIYLPRWGNGSYIAHRVEGNWFYASERWDELMIPAIQEVSEFNPNSSGEDHFSCVVGTGLMTEDGTIKLYRLDENGTETFNYRYPPTNQRYDSVKEHIGLIAPGEEVEVSCWPPRS